MRIVGFIMILFTLTSLSACSLWQEKAKGEVVNTSERTLYRNAQIAIKNRFWPDAIAELQTLEANHPFGRYAQQSQLELIYAHYRNKEPEAANATADRFIRLHPDHKQVDYAYYMKGLTSFTDRKGIFGGIVATDLSSRDPGRATESFNHFRDLITRFPDSQYAPDSIKRMEYLRNLLARHEIHIANYYFEREAYLAATNRGRYVVENFQKSPAIPDALAVMAQGYHLLKLDELAQDSISVLKTNFPEYPAFGSDGEFNFQYKIKGKATWFDRLTLGFFTKQKPPKFDTRYIYNSNKKSRSTDENG